VLNGFPDRDASAGPVGIEDRRLGSENHSTSEDGSREAVPSEEEHGVRRRDVLASSGNTLNEGVQERNGTISFDIQETNDSPGGLRDPEDSLYKRKVLSPQSIRISPPNGSATDHPVTSPSINVTIGRVEVRAVMSGTNRERRQPEPRSMVSLDEYLRKRAGRQDQ